MAEDEALAAYLAEVESFAVPDPAEAELPLRHIWVVRATVPFSPLTGYLAQHLCVCRKFFEKRQQSLDRFRGSMAGKSSPDGINFFQIVHREKQFFASSARLEYINRGIDPLVADLSIENHFHISCALKLLENEFIHF